MPGYTKRRQVIAGVLVRAECTPGRTRAAEDNGRRPIVCTRNRTDPISGCAKNGDAPILDQQLRHSSADGSGSLPTPPAMLNCSYKWIKQRLRIKSFFGTSENAVKSQIWIAISVYILVAIIKKRLDYKSDLYTIL